MTLLVVAAGDAEARRGGGGSRTASSPKAFSGKTGSHVDDGVTVRMTGRWREHKKKEEFRPPPVNSVTPENGDSTAGMTDEERRRWLETQDEIRRAAKEKDDERLARKAREDEERERLAAKALADRERKARGRADALQLAEARRGRDSQERTSSCVIKPVMTAADLARCN